MTISPEKDGCSEDPFECVDQPTVLLAPVCIPNVYSISAAVRKRIV